MVNRYILYNKAKIDLENIFSYVSVTLSNPESAQYIIEAFEQRFLEIVAYPYSYPIMSDTNLEVENLRKSRIGNFNIFYLVNEEESQIEIIRVLYYRSDYK